MDIDGNITLGNLIRTIRTAQVEAKAVADTPEDEPVVCAILLLTAAHMIYLSEPDLFTADLRPTLDGIAACTAIAAREQLFGAPSPEVRH